MNLFKHFRNELVLIVDQLIIEKFLPDGLITDRISVEPPRESKLGDITTNVAMVLAKEVGIPPRDLANLLSERLNEVKWISEIVIAGPGFINIRLNFEFWHNRLREVLLAGKNYGDSTIGNKEKVNVEYVSANPTGPLHVAHARGAVVGDALASLLEKAGYDVTREYYINDAGTQVDTLARSAYLRYCEILGVSIGDIPEGYYPGDYLKKVGRAIAKNNGKAWLKVPEIIWLKKIRELATSMMMEDVSKDLESLGIQFDVLTSENALVKRGSVDEVLEILQSLNLVYTGILEAPKGKTSDDWEPRPQTLFKATEFGDEVDRALKKSDGSWTYFATDIAYHLDKFNRGFKTMVDVWGADHGGYVRRMKAAVEAITNGEGALDVKICQMVHLKKDGEAIRMSKRSGAFVTLSDLIDKAGKDVVRFMMLTRKNDSQMEFDIDKALEQSRDNPVFYVHYAHARCCSVLRNVTEQWSKKWASSKFLAKAELELLNDPAELEVIKVMAFWPQLVESAAIAHEPHRVAYYLNDLATQFHALWNKGNEDASMRFIDIEQESLTQSRLALVLGVANVIASGLEVMGVNPVKEL